MTHCPPDCACRRLVPGVPPRPSPDRDVLFALIAGPLGIAFNPLPRGADPVWVLLWLISLMLLFGASRRWTALREWHRACELATARRCSEPGCPHERALGGDGRCLAHRQERRT